MQQREIRVDYQEWVCKLLGFSFDVQFKSGCSNRVAGVLSRKDGSGIELRALLSVPEVDWSKLDNEVLKDVLLQQIRQDLITGNKVHSEFTLNEGKLFYKDRFVIP